MERKLFLIYIVVAILLYSILLYYAIAYILCILLLLYCYIVVYCCFVAILETLVTSNVTVWISKNFRPQNKRQVISSSMRNLFFGLTGKSSKEIEEQEKESKWPTTEHNKHSLSLKIVRTVVWLLSFQNTFTPPVVSSRAVPEGRQSVGACKTRRPLADPWRLGWETRSRWSDRWKSRNVDGDFETCEIQIGSDPCIFSEKKLDFQMKSMEIDAIQLAAS